MTSRLTKYRIHIDFLTECQSAFLDALRLITEHQKLFYLSLDADHIHRIHSTCMYYLHRYIDLHSVPKDSLELSLMNVAILSLAFKAVLMMDPLLALTIKELLELFQSESSQFLDADLSLTKFKFESRLSAILQYNYTHKSPLKFVSNFFKMTFSKK